jgi:hypothetical protein
MDHGKVREVPFAERARVHREQRAEREAVNWLLAHMAEDLPPDSATAKAITRRASWREILQLAQWEGAFEVATLLEEAASTLGSEVLEEKSTGPKLHS